MTEGATRLCNVFEISPVYFELYPEQWVDVEVMFSPFEEMVYAGTFIIVCDNCQVKRIQIRGVEWFIVNEWLNEWLNEMINEWKNERMNELMNKWINRRRNE